MKFDQIQIITVWGSVTSSKYLQICKSDQKVSPTETEEVVQEELTALSVALYTFAQSHICPFLLNCQVPSQGEHGTGANSNRRELQWGKKFHWSD